VKHVTIRQALQNVADNPVMETDEVINVHVHELVARALYEVANRPDASVRGSLARANKARQMILNRLVGKRRAGSHPATRHEIPLEFVDLAAQPVPIEEGSSDE
jgi:hypothetical protein